MVRVSDSNQIPHESVSAVQSLCLHTGNTLVHGGAQNYLGVAGSISSLQLGRVIDIADPINSSLKDSRTFARFDKIEMAKSPIPIYSKIERLDMRTSSYNLEVAWWKPANFQNELETNFVKLISMSQPKALDEFVLRISCDLYIGSSRYV